MKLIIGLGNPGEKYKNTRHNIGRDLIVQLSEKFNFPKMTFRKKFLSLISEQKINQQKIIIACPETFMNLSGQAITALKKFYKINSRYIWVIYDDLALPLGTIRIRKSGSTGGHKGIQSIIDYLHTNQFVRFRIGIKPNKKVKANTADFVLKKFHKSEMPIIKKSTAKCIEAVDYTLQFGLDRTMNKYNAL